MSRINTKTGVANLMLSLLKNDTVDSIEPPTRNNKAAKIAALWFDTARRAALAEHDWDFATTRKNISSSGAVDGWSQSYQLPSEFIRLVTIGDEALPLENFDYRIENGFILCNEPAPLFVRYVYDCEDIAKWSPMFLTSMVKVYAGYVAASLTGSMNMAAGLMSIGDENMSNAKAVDSQQNPPTKITRSKWKSARNGINVRDRNDY